jgi:hypothetical protein
MNREIKFRAWDTSREKFDDDIYNITDPDDNSSFFGDCVCNGDCILQQYTGMKDINDIELYEGDIVEDPDNGRQVIEWCDDSSGWVFNDRKPTEDWTFTVDVWNTKLIGNIYENPELLEEV